MKENEDGLRNKIISSDSIIFSLRNKLKNIIDSVDTEILSTEKDVNDNFDENILIQAIKRFKNEIKINRMIIKDNEETKNKLSRPNINFVELSDLSKIEEL